MIVNQDNSASSNDSAILKSITDFPNMFNGASEKDVANAMDYVGIEIDSVESLYDYGRSVLQSNLQYMITYFDNTPANNLTSDVCIRHGNLLTQTKVAVKRVMEEAATKKLIYFNNSTVTGLCFAVENCLLDGLQRRIISLFEESHSLALLKKIAKDCDAAAFVLNKVTNFHDHTAPYSATTSVRFFQETDLGSKSPNSMSFPNAISGLFTRPKPSTTKYLWIKLAMLDKKLLLIMNFIMQHHQQYYDDHSIMSTYLSGSLFMELIAGPCSLDFSLVKPSEHIWNDPDASELLNRHKIHSASSWPNVPGQNIYRSNIHQVKSTKSRPHLKIQQHTSPLQMQDSKFNQALANIFNLNSSLTGGGAGGMLNSVAKEYVESLHQNLKHVLLYGKNNVVVQPKENLSEMQGYLSLHLVTGDRLRLNWTPNQLMNGQTSDQNDVTRDSVTPNNSLSSLITDPHDSPPPLQNNILQWDSALSINMENIIYLHCHNNEEHGGKVTLVCQDGVQHPPINFPPGGHLIQFLTCLENGLKPSGLLDPPLLQVNDDKTFPRRYRIPSNGSSSPSDGSEASKSKTSIAYSILDNFNRSIMKHKDPQSKDDQKYSLEDGDAGHYTNSDFVFKIIYSKKQNCGNDSNQGIQDTNGDSSRDDNSNHIQDIEDPDKDANGETSPINTMCLVMRQQILSRAFYGWLHYYRNIKTVKTQFGNLVEPGSIESDIPYDACEGLTAEIWNDYKTTKSMSEKEIYRLIYFGGCSDSIRLELWPRILGHYDWTNFDTSEIDSRTEIDYERSLSQWKALEVIIKQRDNENVVGHIEPTAETKPSKLVLVRQSDINKRAQKDDTIEESGNSIINISSCDFTPSKGFYSPDNSVDESEPTVSQSIIFKDKDFTCMSDNMHRIDKDVDRCDRNHPYFSSHGKHRLKGSSNLRKLRNIMVTWVWEHVDVGYVQGMCDILAPLLVVLDNESLTHACFTKLMVTMISNFPQISSSMDENLSMMALLLQVVDRNLFDHMCPDGEVTSLYVSYRWFLLDFKRELCYADVFSVWETIWSARHVASNHFNLFLALSFLQYYRDIILDNNMEYTDVIKFFNEMAEKHQVEKLLYIARGLIESIREIVQSR